MGKRYFRKDEIVGKDIISDSAMRIGKVKDIGYDKDGRMVLIYDKPDGGEEAIPSSQIIALGDVVLIKSVIHEGAPTIPQAAMPSMKTCPKCGRANPPDYLYCAGCGSRLEGS